MIWAQNLLTSLPVLSETNSNSYTFLQEYLSYKLLIKLELQNKAQQIY